MPFQRSGVELVVRNFRGFVISMSQANRALERFQQSTRAHARETVNTGKQAQIASRLETQALSKVLSAYRLLEGATKKYDKIAKESAKTSDEQADKAARLAAAAEQVAQAEGLMAATGANLLNVQKANQQVLSTLIPSYSRLTPILRGVVLVFEALNFAVNSLVLAFNVVAGVLGFFASVVSKVIGLVRSLVSNIVNLIKSALRPLGDILKTIIGVAGGLFVFRIFDDITGSISNMTSEVITALSRFQQLEIQFEALSARDIAKERIIPVAEAFKYAGERAAGLIRWVKEIAVTTPFTVDTLSTTLAMANAFGINIGMAKRLTLATGNFTAAMGLTEDHMERIIYNFGQMLSQGKLNGREFRDLANSFVPVWQIMGEMAEEAGMTADAFKKMAFEGGVPVEHFLVRFIELAEESFPNAMQRMARTLQGVTNNIKDFLQTIVGIEVFGPVFNKITRTLAVALENLLTPAVRNAATEMGQVLLRVFEYLTYRARALSKAIEDLAATFGIVKPSAAGLTRSLIFVGLLVGRVLDSITAFINQFGQRMAGVSTAAAGWGYNIIASLAKGMAAAAKLVIKVLSFIGQILKFWLSPGSPPKIAPDLPKWGMAAMAEWLRGFTQVDFDVLKGIQDPLKQALDILEETGKLAKGEAGKLFADLSQDIAQAIASGQGMTQVFARLRKAAGPWGKELVELAKRYLEYAKISRIVEKAEQDVAKAVEAVRQAELRLEQARKDEELSRVKITDLVRQYNKELRAGVDKSVLRNRLAQINVAEKAAQKATEERKQAETMLEVLQAQREAAELMLDALQKQQEAIEQSVRLQEQLLEQLLDLTKAQIIEVEVKVGGAGELAAELGDLFGELDFQLPDVTTWTELTRTELKTLEDERRKLFADVQADVDAFVANMEKAFTDAFKPLETEFESLKTLWTDIFNLFQGGILPPTGGARTVAAREGELSPMQKFFEGLAQVWKELQEVDWASVGDAVVKVIQNLGKALADTDWTKVAEGVGIVADKVTNFLESLASGEMAKSIENTKEFISTLGQVGLLVGGVVLLGLAIGALPAIILGALIGVVAFIIAKRDEIGKKLGEIWQSFKDWFLRIADEIAEFINTADDKLIAFWKEVDRKASEALREFYDLFVEWLNKTGKWIYDTFIVPVIDYFKKLHDDTIGPQGWITKAVADISKAFNDTLGTAIENFKTNVWTPFLDALETVRAKLNEIWDWLGQVANALLTLNISKLLSLLGIKIGGGTPKPERQSGGHVSAGQGYVVGERGWELFWPSVSGWIYNQQQLWDMFGTLQGKIANVMPTTMSHAPVGVTNVVNVNMGGVRIYDSMSAAQFEAVVTDVIRRELR